MVLARQDPLPAERLLRAATNLFATDGIRAVGIERILEEAGVARASLYQTYGSKDALIVAYLRDQDARDRAAYERTANTLEFPLQRALLVFDLAAKAARKRNFRGCLYLNAATEFPQRSHPAHEVVRSHRAWLASVWSDSLTELGVDDVDELVEEMTLLYDGGLAGSKVTRSIRPIELARQMAERRLIYQAARGCE